MLRAASQFPGSLSSKIDFASSWETVVQAARREFGVKASLQTVRSSKADFAGSLQVCRKLAGSWKEVCRKFAGS